MLICPCSTRVCMDWQLSLCINSNVLPRALDTVELIYLPLRHLTLIPTSSHSSKGQWQIGMLFLPPSELSSLLMPSKKLSSNSQTLLLTVAEPCHSSSNWWWPIDGYSLKNWRYRMTVIIKKLKCYLKGRRQDSCRVGTLVAGGRIV